jgi:hypothetical protein
MGASQSGSAGGQAPNLGSLMQSMMPMVQSMMSGGGAAGGMDLRSLMSAPSGDSNGDGQAMEGGGFFEQVMSRCMTVLSLPEIMGLVTSGNLCVTRPGSFDFDSLGDCQCMCFVCLLFAICMPVVSPATCPAPCCLDLSPYSRGCLF